VVFSKELRHALTLTAISITAPALFYLPTSMSVACDFLIGIPRGGSRLPNDLLFTYSRKKLAHIFLEKI
jgi:hypothetical protein